MDGVKTEYAWDGSTLMAQKGSKRLEFLYDGNGLYGLTYGTATYYYVYNGQGDVVGLADYQGNQVVSYTYDAWGKPLTITGPQAAGIGELNPFRYRGYYYDAESGLYYLQSRYYDPVVGRFINADGSIGNNVEASFYNLYAYSGNNSVNLSDYTGRCPSGYSYCPAYKTGIGGKDDPSKCLMYNPNFKPWKPTNSSNYRTAIDNRLAVAQTIYGEERGYSRNYENGTAKEGQEAVAWTIINRHEDARFPNDWYDIVTQKYQYTGYKQGHSHYINNTLEAEAWDYAYELAGYMVSGEYEKIPKPNGFTNEYFYFRTNGTTAKDDWKGILPIGGNYYFYQE